MTNTSIILSYRTSPLALGFSHSKQHKLNQYRQQEKICHFIFKNTRIKYNFLIIKKIKFDLKSQWLYISLSWECYSLSENSEFDTLFSEFLWRSKVAFAFGWDPLARNTVIYFENLHQLYMFLNLHITQTREFWYFYREGSNLLWVINPKLLSISINNSF